ncbi:MAG: hypothetical protein HYV28_18715 [Ignavibacteriales bacterium]|nr:hypothetical protein [Ignavibacteriales bacterium]
MKDMIFQEIPDDLDESFVNGALWGGMASTRNNMEMAESFEKASWIIMSKHTKIGLEAYEIVNPLLYLYRHTIELYFKAIINEHDPEVDVRTYSHNLQKLLRKVEEILTAYKVILPESAVKIVLEFYKIDSKSFSFRYGEDFKSGEFWVDFNLLNRNMDWLFDGLKKVYRLISSEKVKLNGKQRYS